MFYSQRRTKAVGSGGVSKLVENKAQVSKIGTTSALLNNQINNNILSSTNNNLNSVSTSTPTSQFTYDLK